MTRVPETLLQQLLNGPLPDGAVICIGIRPSRHAPLLSLEGVTLIAQRGIEGDRYDTKTNGARQVTLISTEALDAVSSFLKKQVTPAMVRRNLATRGINLLALKGRRFRVGQTLLEYSGECAPCGQMEEILGPGGYNAMRGQGGICARILEGGTVHIGDVITRVDEV